LKNLVHGTVQVKLNTFVDEYRAGAVAVKPLDDGKADSTRESEFVVW
jgi:hypothetical protein